MKKKEKKTTVIEIYPECEKPDWVKEGVDCHCHGEGGLTILTIKEIGENAAFLYKDKACTNMHGWESFTKLYPVEPSEYQVISDIDEIAEDIKKKYRKFPITSETSYRSSGKGVNRTDDMVRIVIDVPKNLVHELKQRLDPEK